MPVVFTVIASVRNWKRLREIHHEVWMGLAREVGARRFGIYRDVNDASQVLILAECPDHAAARELCKVLRKQLDLLSGDSALDEHAWEPTGWEVIGDW